MIKQKRRIASKYSKDNIKIDKPCHTLGYCPYGTLVEEFPLKKKETNKTCRIFGHECPIFYVAEGFTG